MKKLRCIIFAFYLATCVHPAFAKTEAYPYGCTSSTFITYADGWKYRCYTHCYCKGNEYTNLEVDSNYDCLAATNDYKFGKGANIGKDKCQIMYKCPEFVESKSESDDNKMIYCARVRKEM